MNLLLKTLCVEHAEALSSSCIPPKHLPEKGDQNWVYLHMECINQNYPKIYAERCDRWENTHKFATQKLPPILVFFKKNQNPRFVSFAFFVRFA